MSVAEDKAGRQKPAPLSGWPARVEADIILEDRRKMFPMLYAKLTGFFANFNYRPREFAARAKAGELLCDRKTSIMTSSAGSREVAGQLTVFVRDPEGKAKTAGDVDFASVQQGRAFVKYIKEFTQAAEVLIAEMEQLERSFKESPRS